MEVYITVTIMSFLLVVYATYKTFDRSILSFFRKLFGAKVEKTLLKIEIGGEMYVIDPTVVSQANNQALDSIIQHLDNSKRNSD